jgi:hypothetical protein
MIKTRIYLIILLTLFLLGVSTSEAQVVLGQKASTTFEIYFQNWKLEGQNHTIKLSQWAFPINCFLPLKDNYELRIFTSAASTGLDNAGGKNNLSGLNDTKIQAAGSFYDDRYLVSLGINLPSGKKSLKQEEIEIAQFLSLDFLNLPVKNFGEGFNLNLTLVRAFEWKNLIWGVGAGYQYNGEYKPYHNLFDYKPGDRLYLTGGVSSNLDKIKLTGDLTYIIYQTDKQGGEKIFKDGNQLDIKGAFFYDQKSYSLAVHTRFIIRAKDKRYGAAKVYLEETKDHGNDFRFSTSFYYQARPKVKLIGQVETKLIGENDYPSSHPLYLGASHIIGLGGGLNYELKDNYYYGLHLKIFRGKADGGNLDLFGFQIQNSLFIRF